MASEKPHSRVLRKNRISEPGRAYLITTSSWNREAIFLNIGLGRLVADEIEVSDKVGRTITYAYVVMPDHLHWLFKLGSKQSLSSVVRRVKGKSSFLVNRARDSPDAVWQPGFHDRAVREEESLEVLGNYVVHNPVRAGLVEKIDDYHLWDLLWQRRNRG